MAEIGRPKSSPAVLQRSKSHETWTPQQKPADASKPQAARSLPANLDRDGIHVDILPALDSADQAAQTGKTPAPAIVATPQQIPLLGPVPDGFGPAYDYLGTVKSLADEIKPGLYEDMFGKLPRGGRGRVYGIGGGMSFISLWSRGSNFELSYDSIARLRTELLDRSDENDPGMLVVEAIDEMGVQALGMALDINPCFFARHIGADRSLIIWHRLPSEEEMILEDRFNHYVEQLEVLDRTSGEHTTFVLEQMTKSVCIEAIPNGEAKDRGRISGCRVSKYGWLILVDKNFSIPRGQDLNPFGYFQSLTLQSAASFPYPPSLPQMIRNDASGKEQKSDIKFDLFKIIRRIIGFRATGRLNRRCLFGSPHMKAHEIEGGLKYFMTLNAWEINVNGIRDMLNKHRHQAIALPTLEAFRPLTLLRGYIAFLEEALVEAKRDWLFHNGEQLDKMLKDNGHGIEPLDKQYDALIDQVRTMATTLNNDIQFVIGSVTVHDSAIMKEDSAIMKKQAARATLLTVLAAIYLPLSLVTGIFGMNIKEINDGAPSFWACIAGVVVIGGATASGIFGFRYWHKHHKAKKSQQQPQASKGDKLV